MIRVCGACTALLAFSVTTIRVQTDDNPTETILLRAISSLFIFLFLGLAVGWTAQTVIAEHSRHEMEKEARVREEAAAAEAVAEAEPIVAEPVDGNPAQTPDGVRLRAG